MKAFRSLTALTLLSLSGMTAQAQNGKAVDTPLLSSETTSSRLARENLHPASLAATSDAETQEIAALLERATSTQSLTDLEAFVSDRPASAWTPSMRVQLGHAHTAKGSVSAALAHWKVAWEGNRHAADGPAREAAEAAAAQYLRTLSTLGRSAEMARVLEQLGNRVLQRPEDQLTVNFARESLVIMRSHPDVSFRCGTLALFNVAKTLFPENARERFQSILATGSPTNGFSLLELETIARKHGLGLMTAQMKEYAPLIVPSVVHWKLDHYAALLERQGGAIRVYDPTAGNDRWVAEHIVRSESSGYYLVPQTMLSTQWSLVEAGVAATIRGMGISNNFKDAKDPGCKKECTCDSGCPGMPWWKVSEPNINLWVYDQPLVYTTAHGEQLGFSVTFKQREVRNYPVLGYSGAPLKAPLWNHNWLSYIEFQDTVAAADPPFICNVDIHPDPMSTIMKPFLGDHPALWNPTWVSANGAPCGGTYSDYGAGWEYLIGSGQLCLYQNPDLNYPTGSHAYLAPDNPQIGFTVPTYAYYNATVYLPEGGQQSYAGVSATASALDEASDTRLECLNTSGSANPTNGMRLIHRDGSHDLFALVVRSSAATTLAGERALAYITAQVDRFGRTNRFLYETVSGSLPRLKYMVDYDGRTNTLSYTNSVPNQVTGVTDPYGRSIGLAYDSTGRLTNIVDAAGLQSGFTYNATHVSLATMTTPYGTTEFAYVDIPHDPSFGSTHERKITITEPDGGKQIYAYRYADVGLAVDPFPPTIDAEFIPTGTPLGTLDNGTGDDAGGEETSDVPDADFRTSYYWGRAQTPLLTTEVLDDMEVSDFKLARRRHWLCEADYIYTSRVLSWEVSPSPSKTPNDDLYDIDGAFTFYDYPGKVSGYNYVVGTDSTPAVVARKLENGQAQYVWTRYNSLAQPTNVVSTYNKTDGTVGTRTNVFTYAANGIDLLTATGADGDTEIRLGYNANRQVAAFTNAVDEIIQFKYDDSTKQLTNLILPTGKNIYRSFYPLNFGTYGNNAGFLQLQIVDGIRTNGFTWLKGLVYQHTNEIGLITARTWDNLERPLITSFPDGTGITNTYEKLDLVQVVDRLNYTNKFVFDSLRRLTKVIDAEGRTNAWAYCNCGSQPDAFTNALGHVTRFAYDNRGDLLTTARPGLVPLQRLYDRHGRLTNVFDGLASFDLEYNNQGLLSRVRNQAGQLFSAIYDKEDRAQTVTNQSGVPFTRTFDALDRPLQITWKDGGVEKYGYTKNYRGPTAYTNQLSPAGIWQYQYDSLNRLITETNANTEITRYTYDPGNRLKTLIDGKMQVTTWNYDAYGRVISKVIPGSITAWTNGYNANGWVTTRWTPAKGATANTYDKVGNLKIVNYPTSTDLTMSYDACNRLTNMVDAVGTTKFTYTPAGALETEDGPWASDTLTYRYTPQGRRQELILEQASGSWLQTYAYDTANRLTNILAPSGAFGYVYHTGLNSTPSATTLVTKRTLPNGGRVDTAFDLVAQLTSTALKNGGGSSLEQHSYVYNLAHQRTTHTFLSGQKWEYTYDKLGQLESATGKESGGAVRLQEKLGYDYDAAGNLLYRTNNALIQTFNVNGRNELTTGSRSGTLTASGNTTAMASSVTVNGQVATVYADKSFAKTGFSLSTGLNVFDATGTAAGGGSDTDSVRLMLTASPTFTYDGNGNLTSDGLRGLAFDDADQLTSVVVTNVSKTEFTYDGLRRKRITKEYTWAATGTPGTAVTGQSLSGTIRNDFTGWVGFRFVVGANPLWVTELGRWVRSGNSGTHSVRLVKSDGTDVPGASVSLNTFGATAGAYLYATLTVPVTLEASTTYYVVSQEVNGGDTWHNYETTLTAASGVTLNGAAWANNGSTTFNIGYNGEARSYVPVNFKFTTAGWSTPVETRQVHDGMLAVQERTSANAVSVTYTRGLDLAGSHHRAGGIGGLLARSDGNGHFYYHSDGNGNVTSLVNQQHALVAQYAYDPYGNQLLQAGSMAAANRYRFSSKEILPATGLYYYGYRFYDPTLQRWVNRDPIQEMGGINLYGFAGNSSTGTVDPLGLCPPPVFAPPGMPPLPVLPPTPIITPAAPVIIGGGAATVAASAGGVSLGAAVAWGAPTAIIGGAIGYGIGNIPTGNGKNVHDWFADLMGPADVGPEPFPLPPGRILDEGQYVGLDGDIRRALDGEKIPDQIDPLNPLNKRLRDDKGRFVPTGNCKSPAFNPRKARKAWEEAHGRGWPKDPTTGENFDVHHLTKRSEGGDLYSPWNILPVHPLMHDRLHAKDGPWPNWP